MKELLDFLETRYSPSEIVDLLNEFDEIKLEDYAIEHDICPRCAGSLMVHKWKEDRGEFWGFPCKENMSELRCENCNETY
jgi:uncharacterized protein YbaR (Trm112 family)